MHYIALKLHFFQITFLPNYISFALLWLVVREVSSSVFYTFYTIDTLHFALNFFKITLHSILHCIALLWLVDTLCIALHFPFPLHCSALACC